MTLQELLDQKAELERQIAQMQQTSRAEAIAKIQQLMAETGLTPADLSDSPARGTRRAKAGGSPSKVAPKYRHPQTGETWSGRGLQPRWLKSALASGQALSDFAL